MIIQLINMSISIDEMVEFCFWIHKLSYSKSRPFILFIFPNSFSRLKMRQPLKSILQNERRTSLFENFFKNIIRIYSNTITNHYEAFSVLRYTKILSFQESIIKLIFLTEIFSKVILYLFYLFRHPFNILHYKELWTYLT